MGQEEGMGLFTQPLLTRMALSYTKKTAQRCRQIASRSPTNLQQSQQGSRHFR